MPTLLVKNADVLVATEIRRRELKAARFLHPSFTDAHIYSQLNQRK
ncbi:MAG: hypothetical protein JO025_11350 [Verrucomicrobia bacterium]|nr:hypothetical protein [Verrucomicrobiota bacterium]